MTTIVYAFTDRDSFFLYGCTRSELNEKTWNDGAFFERFWRSRGSFPIHAHTARRYRNILQGIQLRQEVENPETADVVLKSHFVLVQYPFIGRIVDRTLTTDAARQRYEDLSTLMLDDQLTPQAAYGAINELRRLLRAVANHADDFYVDYFDEGRRHASRDSVERRRSNIL